MKKLKLVFSDFHLGRGKYLPNGSLNVLEDFVWDHKFKEFIAHYSQKQYDDHEIEIIFNGDMLNLMLTDYHGHYTVVVTESVSAKKIQEIIAGHPVFFKVLKKFLSNKKNTLTYVIGNHDLEMLWPETRKIFEKAVGATVEWKNTHHQFDGIHIEHGHQYEAANRIDPSRFFLKEGLPEPILNLPWGTLFAVQFLIKLKMQRPFIDKVRPMKMLIWWSLFHDTLFSLLTLMRLSAYFVSTRFSKNRFRHSSLKSTLKILREGAWFPDLTDAAKRILRTPEIHTVLFGHSHVYKHVQVGEGKQYINSGTWNEILSLDLGTYGRRTKLTYVMIEYPEGAPVCKLRHWIGKIPLEEDAISG